MSFSKVYSAQTTLLKAQIIDVETDLSRGLNSFSIVGLPDKAVEESKDRVSAAIKNSGFSSPKSKNQKIIISLAPADLKKEGPAFDLAIAVAYLLSAEEIKFDPENILFLGELSLDGKLRKIHGVLPLVEEAKRKNFKEIFVPKENAKEAALIEGITVFGAESLDQVLKHLNTKDKEATIKIVPQPKTEIPRNEANIIIDFEDIKGQEGAKRGLEIAAAGGHNVSMYGPPGTGKTMLAKAFINILPDLLFEEILETTSIHSIAGLLEENLIIRPPFRSPHHTASYVSLVGGGAIPKPGEITLAHKGVLFLDEFAEFDRRVIDSLRQPLEDKVISVSRARGTAHFPADFILIAAMNPCPCGNFGFKGKPCICSPINLVRYQRKISGPIIDRIDLWLEVARVEHQKLSDNKTSENTDTIKKRILKAREIQSNRFKNNKLKIKTNSEMSVKDLVNLINLDAEVKNILNTSSERLSLSPRVYHRIIKVARTIADLSESENIKTEHILEAIQYRPKERFVG